MNDSSNATGLPEIRVNLVRAFGYFRQQCHACGGLTEKVSVLCEGEDENGHTVRVCETCLAEGDIDARILAHVERMERIAANTRALIGRLKVPSYAEWLAACDAVNAEVRAERAAEFAKYEELNQ